MEEKNLVNGKAVNCFAMCGDGCSALKTTQCVICKFFKTKKQIADERAECAKRLENIHFENKYEDCYEC